MVANPSQPFDTELLPPPSGDPIGNPVGRKMFMLLAEIIKDKESQDLPRRWLYYYKLKRNKHWKNPDKPGLVTANLLGAHRKRIVNQLCAKAPTFNVRRMTNLPDDKAEAFEDILRFQEYFWQEKEQQILFRTSVDNGETYGVAIEHVPFNPDLEGGLGDPEPMIVDPFYFGVYPPSCLDNQKAEANFYFYPMTIRESRRKWPKYAHLIKPDTEIMKELGDERRTIHGGKSGGGRGWLSEVLGTVYRMFGTDSAQWGEDEKCLICCCYVKDYSVRETETQGDEILDDQQRGTGQYTPAKGKAYAYKGNIRYAVSCNGGELTLEDRDNPNVNPSLPEELVKQTYLWDKFPFTLVQSEIDTSTIWGPPDAEQLEGLQVEMNKLLTRLNMFADKATRLKLKNPSSSGVPDSHLTNRPGIVKPKNAMESKGIEWLQPPAFPMDLKVIFDIFKELFYALGGAELQFLQQQGQGEIAYKTVAALLERIAVMLLGKEASYGKLCRERGRMVTSHVQNFYTNERMIPFKDPETGQDTVKGIVGENLIVPMKLTVVSGSTMPVSRIAELEQAIKLREMGDIDQEEHLKKHNWQDYKTVIKRMQAGPFAALLEMLRKIGTPEPLLQVMQGLQSVDPKKFEQAVQSGELPTFEDLIAGTEEGEETNPVDQADAELKKAQAQKTMAEAENAIANRDLTKEKVITERLIQLTKATGMKLDEEKIKIERAKIVSDMENKRVDGLSKMSKTSEFGEKKSPSQGSFRERGRVSNNDLGARE